MLLRRREHLLDEALVDRERLIVGKVEVAHASDQTQEAADDPEEASDGRPRVMLVLQLISLNVPKVGEADIAMFNFLFNCKRGEI